MPKVLEFIINNQKKSITVTKGCGDRATTKEMVIPYPYTINVNPEHDKLINIILGEPNVRDDKMIESFKHKFYANITSNYPEITIRANYSVSKKKNLASIYVPTEYTFKIIRSKE